MPCAAAAWRLMSIFSCGASSKPEGRTSFKIGLWRILPSSSLRLASKASWPLLLRSCKYMVKPELLPNSLMAGGLITMA